LGPAVSTSDRLLNALPRQKGNPHIFMALKKGADRLSNHTVSKLPKRFGYDGTKLPYATMHGFRSTLGEWGFQPEQGYHSDVLNFCLAHRVGSLTSQAYLRTTMFEQRREIANKWGAAITAGLQPLRTEAMRQVEAKERQRLSNQESRSKHPEANAAGSAKWRKDNPDKVDKINTDKRKAYADNPEPMKAYQVDYRAENRDVTRSYQSGYRAGLRNVYNIPQPKTGSWNPATPEGERAYQKGYRAGIRKAKAKPNGIEGYKPRPAKEQSSNVELHPTPTNSL
jgi:hypothetical protein